MPTKTKEQWKALAREIDPSYEVDDSGMPDQPYTIQEYRDWAIEAGATVSAVLPFNVLVGDYGV